MGPLQLGLFLLTCGIGGTIQASCGFGYGLFVMAIYPYLLPTGQAAALTSLTTILLAALVLLRAWRHVQFKVVWPVCAGYLVPSALAIFFSMRQDDGVMTKVLGVLLIALSVYLFFWSDKLRITPTTGSGLFAGALGGLMGGLFALGGPPVVVYNISALPDKEQYRATQNFYYLIANTWASGTRAVAGALTPQLLLYAALSLVVLLLATWIGNKVFYRLNPVTMRRLVYSIMALSGITMIFK